jgi:hypothetical protein
MIVGFSIIASHLLSFAIILLGTTNFTTNERVELSLLISPVFAVYVAAIVRQFLREEATYDRSPTHPALRILSIGTSTIFGAIIPALILSFTVGKIESFAGLKATVGIVETALGLYTGAVIDRLFSAQKKVSESEAAIAGVAPPAEAKT